MPKLNEGLFITFEGGEGSGKTTVINRVAHELTNRKYNLVTTREPGGTPLGDYIREWILNHDAEISIGDRAELLLFLAARAQHLEDLIIPSLLNNRMILCDRFNESTIAYQGAGREIGVEEVGQLCDLVSRGIKPNLTFFLDVDVETGLARTRGVEKETAATGDVDRIESEEIAFHQRVRDAFHELAGKDPDRIHVINANQPEQTVFLEVLKVIEAHLETL